MAHDMVIECPICGSITRIRMDMAPIHDTPVRLHCGRCGVLLVGSLLYENKNEGEDKNYILRSINFEMPSALNEEVKEQESIFFGEISGIQLCSKISKSDTKGFDSLKVTCDSLLCRLNGDNEDGTIQIAKSINEYAENWYSHRMMFDLYLGNKFNYLRRHYANGDLLGSLNNEIEIVEQIGYQYRLHLGRFLKRTERDSLSKLCSKYCAELDSDALNYFLDSWATKSRLLEVQKTLLAILDNYISVSKYLIPAALTFYSQPSEDELSTKGMSTCTFNDISYYFQDTFERLTDCLDIVVGLDNVYVHNDFNHITNYIEDNNKNKIKKLSDLINIRASKGQRVRYLHDDYPFAWLFAFDPDFFNIRNTIGHSSFSYNEQEQFFKAQKKPISFYLIEFAMKCLEMTKSAVVLSLYVEFLLKKHLDKSE